MANSETVYEAIVALRAESTALRTDLTKAHSVLQGSLTGMGAMAKALAPTLTIAGAVAFGKSVVDTAGQLTDLAAQTQLSTQFLSGIKSTLEEAGSSLDTFARGVFTAQKNLGAVDEEGDQAAQAIARLGLNVKDLQNASPEQFIELIGNALAKIENPTERAAIGAKIFGKSWQEIGPIISDIATRMDELKASGMSEADIKKLDDFGDAITRIGNQAQIAASGALANFADGIDRIFNLTPQATLTNELVRVNDELDKIDKLLADRSRSWGAQLASALNPLESPQFGGPTDELIEKKKELLAVNQRLAQQQADLDAKSQKTGAGDTGGAAGAKAAADAVKVQAKAQQDLIAITRELDQAAMTPLGKTIAEITARYAGWAATGATALKGKSSELAAFNTQLDATKAKMTALAQQEVGKSAVGKFEEQFGVKFDFNKKAAAQDLANNFVAVANEFKNNPAAQEQLNAAFRNFVEQSIKAGTADIPELLKSAGLTDLSGLTFALGPELLKGFQDSEKAGEQWGKTMAKEAAAMQEKYATIATNIDNITIKTNELVQAASEKLAINMETAQAAAALAQVQGALNGIQATIRQINATPVQPVA